MDVKAYMNSVWINKLIRASAVTSPPSLRPLCLLNGTFSGLHAAPSRQPVDIWKQFWSQGRFPGQLVSWVSSPNRVFAAFAFVSAFA